MVKARVKPTTQTAATDEAAIDAVINRGLGHHAKPETERAEEDVKFTWRYAGDLRDRIMRALKERKAKVSLNTWLTEAALEKLDRDGK